MPLTAEQIAKELACTCPSPLHKDTFMRFLLDLLLNINTGIGDISGVGGGGGEPDEATFVPMATFDATTLTGSYQTLLNDTNGKLYISVYNRSSAAIVIRFGSSGSDEHIVSANGSLTLYPGQEGRKVSTVIEVKILSGEDTPTEGSIYASAYY